MTIATRLDDYLTEHNINFHTVNHSFSHSSLQSGVAAGIPLMNLAKGVILEDHEGRHMMAVLPADSKISLSRLNDELNANFHLVKEQEVYQMFNDCEHGAVPPIGSAYHMSTICDESLANLDCVYLEAGDHKTLIQLDRDAFKELMGNSRYMKFSSQIFH
ncbi:aminoacyl-tRNA deacylase [Vibrio sp.]|uniref:aminoacyl-tRNA deacylase n=1 Tax=Vibrio sp. TaxID=678 RepID=UPI003D10B5E1